MQTKNLFYTLLQYLLIAVLGLSIIFIGSKFQHLTFPDKPELFLTYFLRFNLTLPIRLVFVFVALLLGYFFRLNPLLAGMALFLVFPLATLAETFILYPGSDNHNLFPFELMFHFLYAIPSILAIYIGRYFSKTIDIRKGRGSIIQDLKTKHIDLLNYLAFGLLGVLIISICSLFHFHFNNLLQYGSNPGKNPYFFYANYSNPVIVLLFITGLLIGYAYKRNPYLAGLSLYLIFPAGTIVSLFLGILPLKEGLFIDWAPFPFPVMIAVLIGRFALQLTNKKTNTDLKV